MVEKILHNPSGSGHPYTREKSELIPRNPMVGDTPLALVQVLPSEQIKHVWAVMTNEENDGPIKINGKLIEIVENSSIWGIQFPEITKHQTYSYSIFAQSKNQTESAGPYQIRVLNNLKCEKINEINIDKNTVIISTVYNSGLFELHTIFTAHEENVIKIQRVIGEIPHSKNKFKNDNRFHWILKHDNEKHSQYENEFFSLHIDKKQFLFSLNNPQAMDSFKEKMPAEVCIDSEANIQKIRQTFCSAPGEMFFGTGERYNKFNQRGQILDICVFDKYTHQGKKTYLPVPFFISSAGYGFHVNSSKYMQFDFCNTIEDAWAVEEDLGQNLESTSFLLFGSPKKVLRSFSAIAGKPKKIPGWVFGPWMSSNEWNSQEKVMREVKNTMEHHIPCSVLVIEAWSDEKNFYIWNDARYEPKPAQDSFTYSDFTFNPDGKWPDPKGLIEYLHKHGIKVVLWQIPVLKHIDNYNEQHEIDKKFIEEKNYCVLNKEGTPYRVKPKWFNNGLLLDVTNPEAVSWWLSKREYLVRELGIDGFKTDGGEHIWGDSLQFHNGATSAEIWNKYPNLYIQAYHKFINRYKEGDGITFSRAGFTGAQKIPLHWAGDQASTWDEFHSVYYALINAGLSGIPFMGWDLAGFSGEVPSAELYLRAAAMAVFTPIMQYHSDFNHYAEPGIDRTPWNIAKLNDNKDVIPIYREFASLRKDLVPYITEEADYCCSTGEPLMRPLFLDWDDDPEVWNIEDQYLFGRHLLVAPVFNKNGGRRKVYLPEGEWEDFWEKNLHTGPKWLTVNVPLNRIPVYKLNKQSRKKILPPANGDANV